MKEYWLSTIDVNIEAGFKFKGPLAGSRFLEKLLNKKNNHGSFPKLNFTKASDLKNVNPKEFYFYYEESINDLFFENEITAQNIFEISSQTTEANLIHLVNFLYERSIMDFHAESCKKANKSLKHLKSILKEFNLFVDKRGIPRDLREKIVDLIELEEAIYSSMTLEQAKEELGHFLSQKKLELEIKFFQCCEIKHEDFGEWDFILPIYIENDVENFLAFRGIEEQYQHVLIQRIYTAYNEYINKYTQERKYDYGETLKVWEKAFALFPYPLALFDITGDLIKHNSLFLELNLYAKDCLLLENKQKIEVSEQAYEIKRKSFELEGEEHILICFHHSLTMTDKEILPTNEELGIVTSSIAHELNNPLAGILAAVEVLFIDDNITTSQIEELEEIKKGTNRCKDLVETFLGFSKARPDGLVNTRLMFERGDKKGNELGMAFGQALDLIRFRLIENNIKLIHQYAIESEYSEKINGSIFAMIFYLIFGEILTLFSHHQLVSGTDLNKTIKMDLLERNDSLIMNIGQGIIVKDFLAESKLIKHLLELENHEYEIHPNQIIIKTKSQLSL